MPGQEWISLVDSGLEDPMKKPLSLEPWLVSRCFIGVELWALETGNSLPSYLKHVHQWCRLVC